MFILTSLTLPLAALTAFSRTGPGRPEIHQHRLALGFLDDVFDEGLCRRVLDDGVRRDGSSFLQHVSLP
jgi:hypothetical protein